MKYYLRRAVMRSITEKRLLCLRPQEIIVPPIRARKKFDKFQMHQLTESVRVNGIIEPLSVRKNENGHYELISGERRLKAAISLGLRRVPCVLHRVDENTAAIYSAVENLQRSELNFFEQAEIFERFIYKNKISQSELSMLLGIAQSTVANKMRLLRIEPDLREKILAARLNEQQARALLHLPPHKTASALEYITQNSLGTETTEEYINILLNPPPSETPAERPQAQEKPQQCKMVIGDIRLFTNSLTKLIDTLKNAGITAQTKKQETDKYIEYKIRIKKEEPLTEGAATQLRIC